MAAIFDWFFHCVSQFVEEIELAPLLCQQLASLRRSGHTDCLD
jgi:hypothetical protein